MAETKISLVHKIVISLMSAILFIVIGSPMLYKLVNSLTIKYGLDIASPDGCPNLKGLALHGVIFFLVVLLIMQF
jgi:hypothetical protein